MDITVKDKFVRVSPRKARPVLFGLRGEKALAAIEKAGLIRKKAATPLYKLIKSGVAAAKENDLEPDNLYIKAIFCNEGPRLRRRRFESKGRSAKITKRMSHLVLTLTDQPVVSATNRKKASNLDDNKKIKTLNPKPARPAGGSAINSNDQKVKG